MLWIGTNVGLLLSFPLPRLRDGVPIVSGRPYVSLHGHKGAIKFLLPFTSAFQSKIHSQLSSLQQKSFEDQQDMFLEVESKSTPPPPAESESQTSESKDSSPARKSEACLSPVDEFQKELKDKLAQRYRSAPNLLDIDMNDNVQMLYGSLMRGAEHALSRTQSLLKRSSKQNSASTSPLGTASSTIAISNSSQSSQGSCGSSSNNNNPDIQVESKSEKTNPEIQSNKNSVKNKTRQSFSYHSMTSMSFNYHEEDNSNSIIIVSGGNGYQCWNDKPNSDLNSKDNDASLLFWIYKQ